MSSSSQGYPTGRVVMERRCAFTLQRTTMHRCGNPAVTLLALIALSSVIGQCACLAADDSGSSSLRDILQHPGKHGLVSKQGDLHPDKYQGGAAGAARFKLYDAAAENQTPGRAVFSADMVARECIVWVNEKWVTGQLSNPGEPS